jgi:hypothetical protein
VHAVPGRLQRLFTYARSTVARPLENFTTEALAVAIEEDPAPLLRCLAELGLVAPSYVEATCERVGTQAGIGDGGIVDLIVLVRVDGAPLLVWVEVKAHAGLHGAQLDTYLGVIDRWTAQPRPMLIMLAKHALSDRVPTVRWNRLREHSRASKGVYWRDLREFLETHAMADDFDAPVTMSEMQIAGTAHGLLRKATRLAEEFLSVETLPSWRASEFPESQARIASDVASQFRRFRRLVVSSRRYPWVNFGLTFNDGPALELWIEFTGTDVDAREAVFAAGRGKLLETMWTFAGSEPWPWLGATLRLDADLQQERALTWMRARVPRVPPALLEAVRPASRVAKKHLAVDLRSRV